MKWKWKSKEEIETILNKWKEIAKETGYFKIALLALAGIVLAALSFTGESDKEEQNSGDMLGKKNVKQEKVNEQSAEDRQEKYVNELEKKLENQLRQVEGVGDVTVMITLKASSETVVNKDISVSERMTNGETGDTVLEQDSDRQEETVLIAGGDGEESPFVIKEISPEIGGILVICDGGDEPAVIQNITSAAEVIFSVSPHKVKVMKKVVSN